MTLQIFLYFSVDNRMKTLGGPKFKSQSDKIRENANQSIERQTKKVEMITETRFNTVQTRYTQQIWMLQPQSSLRELKMCTKCTPITRQSYFCCNFLSTYYKCESISVWKLVIDNKMVQKAAITESFNQKCRFSRMNRIEKYK